MEQRISLITLGVRDMAAVAAFYDQLGWRRVETQEGVIAFDLIGQTLGLYPLAELAKDIGVAEASLGHGAMTLGHNLADRAAVDALVQRAEAAGATILKAPQEVFWGGYHAYFSDPEGNIWEVAHNPFSPLAADGSFRWNGHG
ncbi:VOC family protein [Marinovum sp. 2_MG-2023]|uniref:VOC family protein n=1 Tax=unclassified Marinovum TaxID=2647166 RepID=UPI0026E2C4AB|nr:MULTISPECIES: VOC family protein [unclassified Marinovum]MDO6728897.1 VOC family protein [Marinovum sp. 2_MG-2023]MDO6777687.1 VOC family protein [Marinovum sp. 1_MG-2023]